MLYTFLNYKLLILQELLSSCESFSSSLSLSLLLKKYIYHVTSRRLDKVIVKQSQVLVLTRRVQVKKFGLVKYTDAIKHSMLIYYSRVKLIIFFSHSPVNEN